MRKFTVSVIAVLMMLGVAGSVSALEYLDINGDHSGPVWMDGLFNNSETWVFDLDNDSLALGEISSGDTILSASLNITIAEYDPDFFLPPLFLEFGDLTVDGTTLVNNAEVDSGYFSLDVISWVADHLLYVTIDDVWGNFFVTEMSLGGEYNPVPEPGTVLLLGSGILGLIALKRKRRK